MTKPGQFHAKCKYDPNDSALRYLEHFSGYVALCITD